MTRHIRLAAALATALAMSTPALAADVQIGVVETSIQTDGGGLLSAEVLGQIVRAILDRLSGAY